MSQEILQKKDFFKRSLYPFKHLQLFFKTRRLGYFVSFNIIARYTVNSVLYAQIDVFNILAPELLLSHVT